MNISDHQFNQVNDVMSHMAQLMENISAYIFYEFWVYCHHQHGIDQKNDFAWSHDKGEMDR